MKASRDEPINNWPIPIFAGNKPSAYGFMRESMKIWSFSLLAILAIAPWVMADLFEMDFGRVKQGTVRLVKVVAYPNRIFQGTTDWVSDTLDPATRTAKVRCQLDNSDLGLKPEIYATAALAVDRQRTLAFTRSAILHSGDQTMAFFDLDKAPDGRLRYERRPVPVNEGLGGNFLPVVRGISANERAATSATILLSGML